MMDFVMTSCEKRSVQIRINHNQKPEQLNVKCCQTNKICLSTYRYSILRQSDGKENSHMLIQSELHTFKYRRAERDRRPDETVFELTGNELSKSGFERSESCCPTLSGICGFSVSTVLCAQCITVVRRMHARETFDAATRAAFRLSEQ